MIFKGPQSSCRHGNAIETVGQIVSTQPRTLSTQVYKISRWIIQAHALKHMTNEFILESPRLNCILGSHLFQPQPYRAGLLTRHELQFLRLLNVCLHFPVATPIDLVCPDPYAKERLAGTKLPNCFKTNQSTISAFLQSLFQHFGNEYREPAELEGGGVGTNIVSLQSCDNDTLSGGYG